MWTVTVKVPFLREDEADGVARVLRYDDKQVGIVYKYINEPGAGNWVIEVNEAHQALMHKVWDAFDVSRMVRDYGRQNGYGTSLSVLTDILDILNRNEKK